VASIRKTLKKYQRGSGTPPYGSTAGLRKGIKRAKDYDDVTGTFSGWKWDAVTKEWRKSKNPIPRGKALAFKTKADAKKWAREHRVKGYRTSIRKAAR